jgi:hypothetical protein
MTTYQEVFQIAQEKGYVLFGYPDYFELCRIQKWLRDDYGLHLFVTPDGFTISGSWFASVKGGKYLVYEQALAEGIVMALHFLKTEYGIFNT